MDAHRAAEVALVADVVAARGAELRWIDDRVVGRGGFQRLPSRFDVQFSGAVTTLATDAVPFEHRLVVAVQGVGRGQRPIGVTKDALGRNGTREVLVLNFVLGGQVPLFLLRIPRRRRHPQRAVLLPEIGTTMPAAADFVGHRNGPLIDRLALFVEATFPVNQLAVPPEHVVVKSVRLKVVVGVRTPMIRRGVVGHGAKAAAHGMRRVARGRFGVAFRASRVIDELHTGSSVQKLRVLLRLLRIFVDRWFVFRRRRFLTAGTAGERRYSGAEKQEAAEPTQSTHEFASREALTAKASLAWKWGRSRTTAGRARSDTF